MLMNPIPWPQKGDKLFLADSNDWRNNACLDFSKNDWDLYAEGYKQAGDILVAKVAETGTSQDFLIYPMVFLYRHYLELKLKGILRLGLELEDKDVLIKKNHDIYALWGQCRKAIEHLWPDGPAVDLDAVEDCIKQISQYDPGSLRFRYPSNSMQGKNNLEDLTHINIRNFGEVINRAASLLEGVHCGMSEYLSTKQDIEMEYRGGLQ